MAKLKELTDDALIDTAIAKYVSDGGKGRVERQYSGVGESNDERRVYVNRGPGPKKRLAVYGWDGRALREIL